MFLANISVLLVVLITFRSVLALSGGFGEIQKSSIADPRWPPFGNQDAITLKITSSHLVTDLKENIYGRNIYTPSVIVITLIVMGLNTVVFDR